MFVVIVYMMSEDHTWDVDVSVMTTFSLPTARVRARVIDVPSWDGAEHIPDISRHETECIASDKRTPYSR